VTNRGYKDWAEQNALYWVTCKACGHEQYIVSLTEGSKCFNCGGDEFEITEASFEEPHGFEVEALKSSDYYRYMVKSLLTFIDFEYIVHELRANTFPDQYTVVSRLTEDKIEDVEELQRIQRAIDKLEQEKNDIIRMVREELEKLTATESDNHERELYEMEDDPTQHQFETHVELAAINRDGRIWRPFSVEVRNQAVMRYVKDRDDYNFEIPMATPNLSQTIKDILDGND
jgi:hypothetical protein